MFSRAVATFYFVLTLSLLAVAMPGGSPPQKPTTTVVPTPPKTTTLTVTVTAPAPTQSGSNTCSTGPVQCCQNTGKVCFLLSPS